MGLFNVDAIILFASLAALAYFATEAVEHWERRK